MLSGSYIKRNENTSRADSLASNLQNSYNDFWKEVSLIAVEALFHPITMG